MSKKTLSAKTQASQMSITTQVVRFDGCKGTEAEGFADAFPNCGHTMDDWVRLGLAEQPVLNSYWHRSWWRRKYWQITKKAVGNT